MPSGSYSRKKWRTGDGHPDILIKEAVGHRDEKYEDYLLKLQHKNRVIKKLETKDEKQKALERKEQGFTLYLNGANQEFAKQLTAENKRQRKQKRARTAREKDFDLSSEKEKEDCDVRSRKTKTAPERSRRKNWCAGSHEIKTSRGVKVRAKAPGLITGNYEDDFEVGESVSTQATYSQDFSSESETETEGSYTDSDTEVEEEEQLQAQTNDRQMSSQRSHRAVRARGGQDGDDGDLSIEAKRYKVSKQKRKDGLEGQGGEQMMLSLKDVKKLRQSLEMNESIRQSIARQGRRKTTSESSGGGSPIQEVEEELESSSSSSSDAEIVEEDDPHDSLEAAHSVTHNRKVKFRPKDVIVLEFDGDSKNKGQKSERQLSAARKGDPASYGALREERRPTPRDRPSSGKKAPPPPPRENSGSSSGSQRMGTPANKSGASILANKKPTPVRGVPSNDVMMKSESNASKKTRPLSANRKSSNTSALDSTVETRAVIEAMRRENASVQEVREHPPTPEPRGSLTPRKTPTPRQSKSAPGNSESSSRRSSDAQPATADSSERRSSQDRRKSKDTGAGPVNMDLPENVDQIVAKVLKLDPRGQRRLLKALALIEDGMELRDSRVRDSHAKTRKSQVKPQPATSSNSSPPTKPPDEPIEIHVEILSNWGHASRIGLTEIQLYDQTGQRIEIGEKNVMQRNVEEPRGEVMNLFNSKCKTTKERYMMSCAWDGQEPVELLIVAPNKQRRPDFAISKLKIWNYNRSLLDLNMGVRRMRISVDNRVVFDGDVDKGCGNQVFDYAKIIKLLDTDSSDSPRDQNTPRNTSAKSTQPEERPKSKPVSEVHLPLELLHQPSEYDDPRDSARMSEKLSVKNRTQQQNGVAKSGKGLDVKREKSDSSNERKTKEKIEEKAKSNAASQSINKPMESTEKPMDSLSTPRQKHRDRKKARGSKMAARLDGSSDIEASASLSNSVTNSVERSPDKNPSSASSKSNLSQSRKSSTNDKPTLSRESSKEKVQESSVREGGAKESSASKQTTVDKVKEESLSVPRPGSGLGGTSDEECLLQQLQNINIREEMKGEKPVPLWLKKERENSKKTASKQDDTLLENWPKQSTRGTSHLKTDFDKKDAKSSVAKSNSKSISESRKSGASINSRNNKNVSATQNAPASSARNSKSTKLDLDSEDFDIDKEVEVEMSKMQQIESARAQWRKKEEDKLEASWNALSLFDRNQKTRLSLDLENDILDEYLNTDRTKPKVATIQEEPEGDIEDVNSDEEFTIPELPKGRNLVINIKTTWGDRHYVGLNGIDVFTNTGEMAQIENIRADPSDINVLPDYENDPRVVSNLIDGINRTRDDTHMWLAPYTKGGDHKVFITFSKPTTIAMMRIWNYNKSRIHSYRGARDVHITLDGAVIFKGEVARACGGIVGGSEAFGDTILFTMDEDILEEVANHDQAFEADLLLDELEEEHERPRTADKGPELPQGGARPFTAAANQPRVAPAGPKAAQVSAVQKQQSGDSLVIKGKCLKLDFTATWGDPHYLGLTGLEVVGRDGEALHVTLDMLHADPRDLHVLPGYERDDRTLDKLIDGCNVTMSDEHMWMVPFTEGEQHVLQITFDRATEMTGLRLWNYNKSSEDTYRGAKFVHVTLDNRAVSPQDGFLIRKGPGNCYFDFSQEVSFTEPCTPRVSKPPPKPSESLALDDASQEYEVVQKPCGFIYQLQLLSTHGDQYYVGLNGLEFYDSHGNQITLTENHISAHPHSVNDLPGVENDIRTPDKLIDGNHETNDGGNMWLAPVLPGQLNRVYVIFDEPMEISMIKIWNYSKTPTRGVKDFALLVDDLLVYNGTLETANCRGILPHVDGPTSHHTIVFTDDRDIRQRAKHAVKKSAAGEQDVQLMNDRKVMAQYGTPAKSTKPVDQALRPKTSVTKGFGKRR